MSSAEANKQVVRGAYEAMAAGDGRGFLGVLAPDIELHEPACLPYGGVYRGPGEVIAFLQQAAAFVAPGKLAVEQLVAEGDTVVAILTLGLRDGSEALVTEIWRLVDGKAAELRVFWFDPTIVAAAA
jgi:ketosteroid isomerase-like protein